MGEQSYSFDRLVSDRAAPAQRAGLAGVPKSVSEEDGNRARLYGLLSRVLAEQMSDDTLEILRGLAAMSCESAVGSALADIGREAVRTTRASSEEEYTALFHGMGSGGEVQPYLSFYLTGFVYEKPLAALRNDLVEMGIARTKVSSEPEDHMAFLCEVMNRLILGDCSQGLSLEMQQKFFGKHLAPWAINFFRDLESANSAKIYKPIGVLGRVFIEIEFEAFEMVYS